MPVKLYDVCLNAEKKGTEIEIRLRSCHECPGCISLSDFKSCKNIEVCGPVERIRLLPLAQLQPMQTRSALQNAGKELCKRLKLGDIVSIEVSFGSEVYMLGVVTKTWHLHEGPDAEYPMGGRTKFRLEPGDELIEIRKFEPIRAGSTTFRLCSEPEKCFLVFTNDARLKIELGDFSELSVDRRSNRTSGDLGEVHGFPYAARYKLAPAKHACLLSINCAV